MRFGIKALMILACVAASQRSATALLYTYDTDAQNFTTYASDGNSFDAGTPSSWTGSDGNPAGSIFGNLAPSGFTLYAFESDLGAGGANLTGLTFTTDFKLSGSITTPNPTGRFYFSDISGNTYYSTPNATSWDPTLDTNWTTHSVALDPSNWFQSNGSASFSDSIASARFIGVLIATSNFNQGGSLGLDGTGTVGIDNFGAVASVPEASALLFGSLICGVVGLAYGRKKWLAKKA